MKLIKSLFHFAIILLFSTNIFAQENKIIIKSSRFTEPLAEKWASEFEKLNPETELVLVKDKYTDEEIDLILISSANAGEFNGNGNNFTQTGRFALLPVTNSKNPYLNELNKDKLDSKAIKKLFFETINELGSPDSSEQSEYDITIYSGNNDDSFAEVFASHFGYLKTDIKGRKISGDDIYLINAVQKDSEGVTFNNLSYIFDIKTRNIKNGLTLIPLDIKKGYREILNELNIDKTITLLENETISLIPIEGIGFVSEKDNKEAKKFIEWVLTEGQKYNREFGFLTAEYEQLVNN